MVLDVMGLAFERLEFWFIFLEAQTERFCLGFPRFKRKERPAESGRRNAGTTNGTRRIIHVIHSHGVPKQLIALAS